MAAVPPPKSCATAAYQSELLPSNVLFIVDRSGSMNCNLPPTTDSASCEQNPVAADPTKPTKWSTIVGSMSNALDGLAQVPLTSAGLSFFSNDDMCGVQSAPNVPLSALGQTQVDTLKAAFANVTPRGGTPIVGSVILGYKHLHQQALAPGNRFVVLVTDGADSCFDTYAKQGVTGDVLARLLDTEIPKAISVNIRTFVIGAPGSEAARGLLSKIAYLGGTAQNPSCDHDSDDPAVGTACHFDMTATQDFAKDLSAALQSITGSARTCDFDVPTSNGDGGTVDPSKVNVDYYQGANQTDPAAHVELSRDDTKPCDAGAAGWQYIDGNVRIRVCGPVCDQIRADGNAEVVVSLGCEQRVVVPH
jgi:hypothetical protein